MQNPVYILLYVVLGSWCAAQPFTVTAADQIGNSAVKVDIGVILDLNTLPGKIRKTSMLMALEDFYATHKHAKFRLVPHIRDSKSDAIAAASAGIDLLKNVQVQAILGPQRSAQAPFVIDLGDKAQVPIISSATSSSFSPKESPFYVRAAHCSSFQSEAIAEIAKAFGWRQAVIVYEDSVYGSGMVPLLTDALLKSNTIVPYRSVLSPSASDDQILEELYKLMTMQTRVFVVHLPIALASRLFVKAKEAGMMRSGYAWIITEALTVLLDSVKPQVIDSMQGVLGLKPYVLRSDRLVNFTSRWRKRFRQENPEVDRFELNVYGLWAYDSATALAMAAERMHIRSVAFPKSRREDVDGKNLLDLNAIRTSEMGAKLIKSVRSIRLDGLSGDFHIVDGQLQPSAFEIVNIIGKGERRIGFWSSKYGISKKLQEGEVQPINRTPSKDNLEVVIWPGETTTVPKGWEIPTSEKKLRVGVPLKGGLEEFIKVERDPLTNSVIATGFCIEVFKEVMTSLPYFVPYEYVPFETPDGESAGDYNDLVYQIFLQKYDAVVGDVTILANRSRFVDFTLPFTESGVATLVRIKHDERGNAWIFMKPLTTNLWLTIGAFFIFIGFVVWVIEHRVNKDFRGPARKQVGMIFWFSFSTMVFAHREKVRSNLSRFVVIVWVFVVLVLTSSYTANLTSMLTVQQLQPAVTDLYGLTKNGAYIGYQTGSFITEFLKSKKFDGSKFRHYNSFEEYDEALSKGSRNGGVDAIVDELPYIRLFLAKYCKKYTLVGPIFKTAGFGFAFPKGSPLVPDVSRAVLNVTEGDKMLRIVEEWLGDETKCGVGVGAATAAAASESDSLTVESFRGLFLIAGLASASALGIFLFIFLSENREVLGSDGSVIEKLRVMAKNFDEDRTKQVLGQVSKAAEAAVIEETEEEERRRRAAGEAPGGGESPLSAMSYFQGQDEHEGFSSATATEPGSPARDHHVMPNLLVIQHDSTQ